MNRNLLCLAVASITLVSSASFADSLAQRAQDIANRLKASENNLTRKEARDVGFALRDIEDILSAVPGSSGGDYVCVSDGGFGSFEKFTIRDLNTGKSIGGGTSKVTCESSLSNQNQGLICLSDGGFGSFEKFTIYDNYSSKMIGSGTSAATCQSLVKKANSKLVCLSNGGSGSFEKFTLYNRATGQLIGGDTTAATCLSTIR